MRFFILFSFLFLLNAGKSFGQFQIYDYQDSLIAVIEDNQLKSDGEVLFTIKGKIIYTGDSDRRRNMLWLVQIPNFQGSRSGKLTRPNRREADYTSHRSAFYHGNAIMDRRINRMLNFEHDDEKIALKKGLENTPTGHVKGDLENISGIHYAVIFAFMKDYLNLDAYVMNQISDWGGFEQKSLGQGTIKRLWDGTRSEFIWDGKILKKRWVSDGDEWEFDGRILRNAWSGTDDEFEWDGQVLRRRWGSSPDEFILDGNTIRPRFGGGQSYVIQGNIVRKQFGSVDRDEWEIQGDIPIPIIILIVYRVIK